ncbi:MAG: WecB/TagA/CpsF family glycosyltransferase [Defluviitaleaceae bacterium]|nr:WecB/TagA/CpsF family glycosyltransferase [Defluviitaleaceae bacterium]
MANILGIPFNPLTVEQTLTQLEQWLETNQNHIIVTPNPEGVMQARRNKNFAQALLKADLRLADGIGILLAARLKCLPLPERVRGVDTIYALFQRLSDKNKNYTAYFLGGKPGVPELAKANMEARFPGLRVIGTYHGHFQLNSPEEAEIITEINALSPDILLVCMGMPRAEIWATTHHIDARLTLSLGGTIDIMSGQAELAPAFLRKIGLEWLHRLYKTPSRFMRMLDIPRFMWAVLFER